MVPRYHRPSPPTFKKMNNLTSVLVVGRKIQKVPVGCHIYLARIGEADNVGGVERNGEDRQIAGRYLRINTDNTENAGALGGRSVG